MLANTLSRRFIRQSENRGGDQSYLPISVQGYSCYQDNITEGWAHTTLRSIEKDGTRLVDIRVYDTAMRPVAELKGLSVRMLPIDKIQAPQAATDDMFYRVAWRSSTRAAANSAEQKSLSSWIIFADHNQGLGAALANQLEASGHHCHLVYKGETLTRPDQRQWTINENEPQDFHRLLGQFSDVEPLPCDGVIFLWGLDAPAMQDLTLSKLQSANEEICRGALAALHAVAATRSSNTGKQRLWFVTANAQAIDSHQSAANPLQAPLWGLARTTALEYPRFWGGIIDLQINANTPPDIAALAQELLAPDGETQIALSGRQRYVARFVNQPATHLPWRPPAVHSDATYLITGGLGMIGRSVAKWLIARGAKHIVLTGRNANPDMAKDIFSAAELNSAAIYIVAANISREDDVRSLIQTINKQYPPLRGVVHSAGVIDDGILAQLSWDRFQPLFEPRVYGSWLLHEHTKACDLDFFIMKSSLLSVLGSAGQGNYTASSAFMDSLANYRRASGLPAMTVNWTAWSEGGLALLSGERGEAMWDTLGVEFISPEKAMRAFDRVMHRDVEQIAIAIADWPKYGAKLGKPAILSELMSNAAPPYPDRVAPNPQSQPNNALLTQAITDPVNTAEIPARPEPGNSPHDEILVALQHHVSRELGFDEIIELNQPLNEIGLDSLLAVSVSNSLENAFGITVPIPDLIRGPTLNQLAEEFFTEFVAKPSEKFSTPPQSATTMPASSARLSPTQPTTQSQNNIAPAPRREQTAMSAEIAPRSLSAAVPEPPLLSHSADNIATTEHELTTHGNGQRTKVLATLQRLIMAELGFEDEIDPDEPLNEIGLDSLLSVRLANNIEEEFDVAIAVADLIIGPTINQIAEQHLGAHAIHSPTENIQTPPSAPNIAPTPVEPLPNIPATPERPQSWPQVPLALPPIPPTAAISPPLVITASENMSADQSPNPAEAPTPDAGSEFNDSRRAQVLGTLQRLVMTELGFAEKIDPDEPLNEIGLDSLLAVRLANGLEEELGVPIAVADLITGPSINQLADQLTPHHSSRNGANPPTTALPSPIVDGLAIANPSPVTAHARPQTAPQNFNPLPPTAVRAPAASALPEVAQSKTPDAQPPFETAPLSQRTEHSQGSQPDTQTSNADQSAIAKSNGIAPAPSTPRAEPVSSPQIRRRMARPVGKWLIAPQPNPNAKMRLFCFPYAGGGLVSFRTWPKYLLDTVEMVAIEPPGRGTRIKETVVTDLDTFVKGLLPELQEWLDRPSAFFGNCLGGLTMFNTLPNLPATSLHHIKHAFACGVRPPQLLNQRGAFEDNLLYNVLLHRDFDFRVEPYNQPDDLFAYIISHFDTPDADEMLAIPRLRDALLPTVRADFGMAYHYVHKDTEPFEFPITSFVGKSDPWVSVDHSAGWGRFTRSRFTNHARKGSHFLMKEDRDYVIKTINEELLKLMTH